MDRALSGVTVLEWCEMVAGPYCGKLMADLGAYVIKIEDPGGDPARRRGPFLHDIPHPERSGLFLYLNTNKRGVTLNVGCSRGQEIFKELAKRVDILVEDKPPGTMKSLGLDYESLRNENPKLVMTSITPFGQTGPYRNYKAHPLNTFFAGGEGYMTPTLRRGDRAKWQKRPPVKIANYWGEYIGGISAAGAIMCALFGRERSGRGQHIDISKQEALISLTSELQQYPHFGAIVDRFTHVHDWAGRYPCKDGYIEFIPYMPHHQAMIPRFFAALGMGEWLEDERMTDVHYYDEHVDELRPVAAEVFKKYTRDELFALAREMGMPFAPYLRVDEVVNSAQLALRGFFVEAEHKETGRLKYASAPYRYSETPWAVARPAPLLGEHNDEVYCGWLHLSKEALIKLRGMGVL